MGRAMVGVAMHQKTSAMGFLVASWIGLLADAPFVYPLAVASGKAEVSFCWISERVVLTCCEA